MNTIPVPPSSERTIVRHEPTRERLHHEIGNLRSDTRDVLTQLRGNIARLDDMCGRLQFVMGELRSVIKR
ncbi:MAG: hypothetical protein AB7F86_17585 [Bdellovibrionales bacterium]